MKRITRRDWLATFGAQASILLLAACNGSRSGDVAPKTASPLPESTDTGNNAEGSALQGRPRVFIARIVGSPGMELQFVRTHTEEPLQARLLSFELSFQDALAQKFRVSQTEGGVVISAPRGSNGHIATGAIIKWHFPDLPPFFLLKARTNGPGDRDLDLFIEMLKDGQPIQKVSGHGFTKSFVKYEINSQD